MNLNNHLFEGRKFIENLMRYISEWARSFKWNLLSPAYMEWHSFVASSIIHFIAYFEFPAGTALWQFHLDELETTRFAVHPDTEVSESCWHAGTGH
jgi:hypothetical protein